MVMGILMIIKFSGLLFKTYFMNRIYLLFFIAFLIEACTKDVFIIEEPEKPAPNQSPGDFNIDVLRITDSDIELSWSLSVDPDNENVSYEVAVNDSVIGYDITSTGYTITGLTPGIKYKIGVIAHDRDYNISKKEIIVETKKSFFNSFYSFDLGYDELLILGSAETSDGGIIFCGVGNPYQLYPLNYNNFVVKINPDYSVAWYKIYEWDNQGDMSALESHDGTCIVAWKNTVIKFSQVGDEIWKYKCPANYNIESLKLIEESENGELLLYGVKLGNQLENSIIRLDNSGREILHEWGGNYPVSKSSFIKTPNGETLILGKTNRISVDGVFKLSKLDKNGDLIKEIVYPNKFNGTDLVHSIIEAENGNYLLLGSTYGYVDTWGVDFCPHIIKIDSEGKIIWEKFIFESETGGGLFRTIQSVIKIDPNNYILYIFDEEGFAIAQMNNMGEIVQYKKANGYLNSRHFTINKEGKYVSLTDYGIIIFNPDGYVESSSVTNKFGVKI